ncbi:acetate--CoA ligase family protein [Desulfobulbus oligotrophicus]|jgi:acetyltransferase|uniref:Acetate--CoA ligase family protein n=1 Tax=Desulfobulbus oligotrophicus TaxID=1909699 RepID=A0A7T6AQV8_9BACT|nr:acetate--CoA ligase [Desulfobulbus oligotrophicus]MDY0391040.1 acetate--CoA ligase family protein [Desulfobulbus oligotrophicus]QQG66218.1 acetate--CoA ligase family protein [Desulfobulbus oligotrophicus]
MLERLFSPKSIAVIGASRTEGKVGYATMSNLLESGFAGPIIPVNPAGGELFNLPVYTKLADYPDPIDLVVVAVPAEQVPAAAEEAVRKKAGAIIVVAAGFREAGRQGRLIEDELIEICRKGGVRLLGPNCLGVINTAINLNASFSKRIPQAGQLGIFSQSGALCTAMMDIADERELGVSKAVSIGNKADITEVDILEALAHDEETRVIVGYLEDISDGDKFVKAAEKASTRKPVVILKAGITVAGNRAAASHTGVQAGKDTAYGAAFKRAGICRADSFEALFDYATALALQPTPKGDRVLIITNAGGSATMSADAVEKAGMSVPLLTPDLEEQLRQHLPPSAFIDNPVDISAAAEPRHYAAAIDIAVAHPDIDSILIVLAPQYMTEPAATVRAIVAHLDETIPVIASFLGGSDIMPSRKELAAAGLPFYDSPERAVGALKAMHEYGVWKHRPARHVVRFPVNRRRVERIITRRQHTNRLRLGEVKSKDILKAYGFQILPGRVTTSAEEAVEIARFIGFPVALKVISPSIVHKSDLGGVRLNLGSAQEVVDAFDLMMLRINKHAPNAIIGGIYVEKMAEKGLEVIIGMTRDPQFGPMLMFGLGGIFVEVMKDVTFHLAPITEDEAIQMLKSTRSYELLQGKRGVKEVDLHAIAVALQRISQLTTDFPQILDLDINPLIVGEIGNEPVVVDARMTFAALPEEQ